MGKAEKAGNKHVIKYKRVHYLYRLFPGKAHTMPLDENESTTCGWFELQKAPENKNGRTEKCGSESFVHCSEDPTSHRVPGSLMGFARQQQFQIGSVRLIRPPQPPAPLPRSLSLSSTQPQTTHNKNGFFLIKSNHNTVE